MVSYAYPTVNLTFKIAPDGTALHSDAFREAANTDEAWKATIVAGKAIALSAYDMLTQAGKAQGREGGVQGSQGQGREIGARVR